MPKEKKQKEKDEKPRKKDPKQNVSDDENNASVIFLSFRDIDNIVGGDTTFTVIEVTFFYLVHRLDRDEESAKRDSTYLFKTEGRYAAARSQAASTFGLVLMNLSECRRGTLWRQRATDDEESSPFFVDGDLIL
ncbi:hypothetical protein F4824DRAFT_517237 [Ustulina deusta]|nr:hypothetical protein F4824DRAFT_517237 [Ustulina deusta]